MDKRRDYDHLCKVVVVGDCGTGKSSLLSKFVDDRFETTYLSTIGVDFKIRTIDVDDRIVKLQIWDTAGSERFRSITRSYYRDAELVIIVYDVTDISSLNSVPSWRQDAELGAANPPIFMLVGTKADLTSRREIKYQDGENMSKSISTTMSPVRFFECSAKTGENVEEIFKIGAKCCIDTFASRDVKSSPKEQVVFKEQSLHERGKTYLACCY